MARDRCLERGRKKQGRDDDSCHFFDHYFLPCFLSYSKTSMEYFNIKMRLLIRET